MNSNNVTVTLKFFSSNGLQYLLFFFFIESISSFKTDLTN